MGMLRSKTDHRGLDVDGVTLGFPALVRDDSQPAQPGDGLTDLWFAWDDAALPDGTIDAQGTLVVA